MSVNGERRRREGSAAERDSADDGLGSLPPSSSALEGEREMWRRSNHRKKPLPYGWRRNMCLDSLG
jgi:hypothetical protein